MIDTYVKNILSDTSGSLIESYLTLQTYFEEKYGSDALVLMEVGSFFEIYGIDADTQKIGKPKEVADVLNLQLTRKNKSIKENSVKNPLMAGFPTASFERYIERLVKEEKYTIIIIRQKGTPPNVERFVDTILSPGIHLEYNLNTTENFVASVVIDKNNSLYSIGYSAIDVTTGKTYLAEAHSTKDDPSFALDELFRLLQSHHTSEIICTILSDDIDAVSLYEYIETEHVHENTKRAPVTYQNELFKRAYIVQSFLSPIEFLDLERQPLTSESLAILIEFIVEHDQAVIEGLKTPIHITARDFLYLGNNPLEQLNIISRDPKEYTVLKHMDKTVTSMGKRLFKNRLLSPITRSHELHARYDLIEIITPELDDVRRTLTQMYDIERIHRRIQLKKLHPYEINFLIDSLESTQTLAQILQKNAHTTTQQLTEMNAAITDALHYFKNTFNTDIAAKYLQNAIEESFFQPGIHTELDILSKKKISLEHKLHTIKETYEGLLQKETGKSETDYLTIKQLDKDGHYLTLTKSRYALIEDQVKETFFSLDETVYALKDFTHKQLTSTVKISAPLIDSISEEIVVVQSKIIALVKELFEQTLSTIETNYGTQFSVLVDIISQIDVAQSNALTAREYVLCRPEIIQKNEEEPSFFAAHDLRHPLVEAREQQGLYVPNTIILGDRAQKDNTDLQEELFTAETADTRGLLLYGINSSGKSSLMKSIGVTVLLAQAGCYVPATSLRFTIIKELFTRIIARDNYEKGLSSFAVEMIELKNIFNRSTNNSLILGDEISHGTETKSAIAIVSATILRLISAKSLFIFTTHLHELMQVPALKDAHSVQPVHLSVHFDKKADRLIFDRQLQSGSGTSIYGLEFAQSLHMDETFLKHAQKIRKELTDELTDIERLTKRKKSKYNTNVYLSSCALCNDSVDDTHHISEQSSANDLGKINHIDKDHASNLLPICRSCHEQIHAGKIRVQGFVMTSDGLQLRFDRADNE